MRNRIYYISLVILSLSLLVIMALMIATLPEPKPCPLGYYVDRPTLFLPDSFLSFDLNEAKILAGDSRIYKAERCNYLTP